MSEYKIANVEFENEAEYQKAKKELLLIKQIKDKFDINDPKVAKNILEKFKPQTVFGSRFAAILRQTSLKEAEQEYELDSSIEIESKAKKEPENEIETISPYDDVSMETINSRLMIYSSFLEEKCPTCRYIGKMGVVKEEKYKTGIVIVLSFITATIWTYIAGFTGIWKLVQVLAFIPIAFSYILIIGKDTTIVKCPRCERIIRTWT